MVREVGGVVAYTWVVEGENSHWEKVGSVLGGVDPKAGDKTTYEGKSYDFVFSVDVEDGKPPLKLPYNKGEDPYVAAHKFIEKHMLPPDYLDQVVNFITTNSKQNEEPNLPAGSNYVDPFTGSSRYMPSSGTAAAAAGNSFGANLDPFTGENSSRNFNLKTRNFQVRAATQPGLLQRRLPPVAPQTFILKWFTKAMTPETLALF